MKKCKRKLKGFSLAEILLAIGIFGLISSFLIFLVVDSTRTLDNLRARSKASHLTQEINDALLLIKTQGWYNIARYTDEGAKHLEFVDGNYTILDGAFSENDFTYSFTIQRAQRDLNGDLVETGGTLDPHTRIVSITIDWKDRFGKINSINPKLYINDWNTNSIAYTTDTDFQKGVNNQTLIQNISGGEVRLQSMKYADWCNPSLSQTTYDLQRQGIPANISTNGESVYMGTGGNASGYTFIKLTATGDDPMTVTEDETFDGYKANDIFSFDNTVLIATDDNEKKVVFLDTTISPFSEVGSFKHKVAGGATTVFEHNGYGFTTYGNKTLSMFDLSVPSGIKSALVSITLSGNATDIYVDDSYIYLTLAGSSDDFVIYSYTTGSSPTLTKVSGINLNSVSANGLFISNDINRAYIVTERNSGNEFFILNITNKVQTPLIVSSFDTLSSGDLAPKTVASIDNRAILGGAGTEQYLVLDITEETAPIKCGGLTAGKDINAISLVKKGVNHYTYLAIQDSNAEFKIIRGGPGGGGEDGNGYLPSGTYTSEIFDTNSETSSYYVLGLITTVPTGTSLQIQFRVSNNPDMSGSSWIGEDGTSTTYFSATGIYDLPYGIDGRYIQFRATFESDTIQTPLLEEIVFNYEK
ncbi:MAG: hypothetical protein PHE21_01955 [Candidatus Dojkabacteria bacterium]|nr:hypothetical protein [Candidatus Dojkabacteria bacterium]